MVRAAVLLVALVMGACGPVYVEPDGPDAGSGPPPHTGPWMYVCSDRITCPGVDPVVVGGGMWCARDPSTAAAKEKEQCGRNCLCAPSCTRTSDPC